MSTDPTYADRTATQTTTTTTPTIGEDPWADTKARDTAEQRIGPFAAPYTFDHTSTHRLRNCTDEHNAAMPNGDGDTDA